MARMSIDDKFLRDPRITQLALDLGMSRWEAMGRLLAVFSVCYDLERDVVSCKQIDLAAERPGFGDAMFAVDLAVNTRRGLRIRGAGKRIEYLAPKREAGRQGGIKSGESRRNSAKQKREIREARPNPPDPVPDLAPDPVPEDRNSPSARAIPPTAVPIPHQPGAVPPPAAPIVPAGAPPRGHREDIARTSRGHPPRPIREWTKSSSRPLRRARRRSARSPSRRPNSQLSCPSIPTTPDLAGASPRRPTGA